MTAPVWYMTRPSLAWFATGLGFSQLAWWATIDAGVDVFASSAAIMALGLPAYAFLVYHLASDLLRLLNKRRAKEVEA